MMVALLEDKKYNGPKRLIYVSCGFKALKLNIERLVGTGQWKIVHAEGHVLFPGSNHLETLVIFDRRNK